MIFPYYYSFSNYDKYKFVMHTVLTLCSHEKIDTLDKNTIRENYASFKEDKEMQKKRWTMDSQNRKPVRHYSTVIWFKAVQNLLLRVDICQRCYVLNHVSKQTNLQYYNLQLVFKMFAISMNAWFESCTARTRCKSLVWMRRYAERRKISPWC